jgi:hypothetical protein
VFRRKFLIGLVLAALVTALAVPASPALAGGGNNGQGKGQSNIERLPKKSLLR